MVARRWFPLGWRNLAGCEPLLVSRGVAYGSGSARMAPLLALPSWWPVDHESCITHGHLAAGRFCWCLYNSPAEFEILHIWQATQSAVVLFLEYVLICFKIRVTVDCHVVMHMSYICYNVWTHTSTVFIGGPRIQHPCFLQFKRNQRWEKQFTWSKHKQLDKTWVVADARGLTRNCWF